MIYTCICSDIIAIEMNGMEVDDSVSQMKGNTTDMHHDKNL